MPVRDGLREVRSIGAGRTTAQLRPSPPRQQQRTPEAPGTGGVNVKEADVHSSTNEIEIILKLHRRGSLANQLQDGTWDPSNAPKVIRQLTEALLSLHKWGVMHRDIQPGNILLSDYDSAILCDLGIARNRDESLADEWGTESSAGTLPFMAPEMCASPPDYGFPVDVGDRVYDPSTTRPRTVEPKFDG